MYMRKKNFKNLLTKRTKRTQKLRPRKEKNTMLLEDINIHYKTTNKFFNFNILHNFPNLLSLVLTSMFCNHSLRNTLNRRSSWHPNVTTEDKIPNCAISHLPQKANDNGSNDVNLSKSGTQ